MKRNVSKFLRDFRKASLNYTSRVLSVLAGIIISSTLTSVGVDVMSTENTLAASQASEVTDVSLSELTKIILSEGTIKQEGNGQTTTWTVYIDGEKTDVIPILYKDANYLPIRATGNALDASVGWNAEDKVAILEKDNIRLELPQAHNKGVTITTSEDSTTPSEIAHDYSSKDSSLSVININGSTYLPLRYIGEQLGYTITVDVNTKSAYFNSPDYTPTTPSQDTYETETSYKTELSSYEYVDGKHCYYDAFGEPIDNPYNVQVPEVYRGSEIDFLSRITTYMEVGDTRGIFKGLSTEEEKLQRAFIIATANSEHEGGGYAPNPSVDDIYSISQSDYMSRLKWYVSEERQNFIKKSCELAFANTENRTQAEPGDYYCQPYYEKFNLPKNQNWGWYWGGGSWVSF